MTDLTIHLAVFILSPLDQRTNLTTLMAVQSISPRSENWLTSQHTWLSTPSPQDQRSNWPHNTIHDLAVHSASPRSQKWLITQHTWLSILSLQVQRSDWPHDVLGSLQGVCSCADQLGVGEVCLILPVAIHAVPGTKSRECWFTPCSQLNPAHTQHWYRSLRAHHHQYQRTQIQNQCKHTKH